MQKIYSTNSSRPQKEVVIAKQLVRSAGLNRLWHGHNVLDNRLVYVVIYEALE